MQDLFTPAQIERLKRDAKRLHKISQELSNTEALDKIAQTNGYRNWALLSYRGRLPSEALPNPGLNGVEKPAEAHANDLVKFDGSASSPRPRPSTPWFDRGFDYEFFSVPEADGRSLHDVSKLTIWNDPAKPDDVKLIYDEIESVARLGGGHSTVWLNILGYNIPDSVHSAIRHLVGFGVALVVTFKQQSSLSQPETFPEDFLADLRATYKGGRFWCPIAEKLMHPFH